MMVNKKNIFRPTGFTLMEVIVSLGIFTLFITLSVGIFIKFIQESKRTQIERSMIDQARSIMARIKYDLSTAKVDYTNVDDCHGTDLSVYPKAYSQISSNDNIFFRDAKGDCRAYGVVDGQLKKFAVNATADPVDLTDPVALTDVNTRVNNFKVDIYSGNFAATTTLATILLDISPLNTGKIKVGAIRLQEAITLSASRFDLYKKRTKLNPTSQLGAQFGWSVAIDGDKIVIGAPYEDVNSAENDNFGAAYYYDMSQTNWENNPPIRIPMPDTQTFNKQAKFGYSVAISGNKIVIGAPDWNHDSGSNTDDYGAAYYYEVTTLGSWWTNGQLLSPRVNESNFGSSVAIDGNQIIVGAPRENPNSGQSGVESNKEGAAYYYTVTTSGSWWSNELRLEQNLDNNGSFGEDVAIKGDIIVVGGQDGYDPPTTGTPNCYHLGKVYLYDLTKQNWWEDVNATRIASPNPEPSEPYFGSAVDYDGQKLIFGARNEDAQSYSNCTGSPERTTDQGTAYFYSSLASSPDRFSAPTPQAQAHFGVSVAISNGRVIIGSGEEDVGGVNNAGAVYLYFPALGGAWSNEKYTRLISPDPIPMENDLFGASVDISGLKFIVGAPKEDNIGAAYVYY